MNADLYENVAPYYDLLHASLTEDIGFVLSLASGIEGPVLELGCGTGRLLLPLARAGHRVTGIDSSREMLSRARERISEEPSSVRQRIQLVRADAAELELAQRHFALALFSYNTLLHLPPAAATAACRRIRRHLAPNGLLFLDVVNPALVEQTPNDHVVTLERTLSDPQSGDLLMVFACNDLDPDTQILNVTWIFDTSPAQGGAVHRRVAEITYHYYYLHQLEIMLEESGLKLEATYGDYREVAFTEESERLLILARHAAQ